MKFVVVSLRVPPQVLSHVKLRTPEDPIGYDMATLAVVAGTPGACPIVPLDDSEPTPPIGAVYLGGVSFGPVPPADADVPADPQAKLAASVALKERRTRLAALLDGQAETQVAAAATARELDAIVELFLGKP